MKWYEVGALVITGFVVLSIWAIMQGFNPFRAENPARRTDIGMAHCATAIGQIPELAVHDDVFVERAVSRDDMEITICDYRIGRRALTLPVIRLCEDGRSARCVRPMSLEPAN